VDQRDPQAGRFRHWGLAAFLLLAFWKVPPWLVVMFGAATAQLIAVW
jgi:hypothetical protein